jgi:DNA helicase-2/ATP-dependent DNA helicase PcrA
MPCYTLFPNLHSYKLEDLIEIFKIEGENTHNAIDDVRATANLIKYVVPDIENLIPSQNYFYEANNRLLLRFRSNLFSLWSSIQSDPVLETTFRSLINKFMEHSSETVSYFVDPDDLIQLEKLLANMDNKTSSKSLDKLLKKYLPHYKTCKESDLITENEKVIISPIYKAKGLQFDNVIIPECVDGVYPFYKSNTSDQKLEDARLLYVALTRSKLRLIITRYTLSVNQWGKAFSRNRSPFIDPILSHFSKTQI